MRNAELTDHRRPAVLPPVLCYHRIGGPAELGITRVAKSVFARQVTALARAGWKTLTLDQFAEQLRPGHSAFRTPHSALLLTFDDGYASLAEHVYPILADVGFTATTFLITDYVGRLNTWDVRYTWRRLAHLDWDTIGRWQARGFGFASHTASHQRLTWLSDRQAAAELERSRETLRHRLGPLAARAVAYPFGARDERIERLANAAGYELGFGGVHGNGSRLALARLPVYLWDVGALPLGLREDGLGWLGRAVAHTATRCAVGTSVMQGVRSWVSGVRRSRTRHLTPDT
jgi:peptidoglycan/xylan/chitin deacetylase (PgdA/CDA1 family)